MPHPANKHEQLNREAEAWAMRCRGKTERQIAEHLGVTQPAVNKILKRVAARRYKELAAAVEEQKTIQTEQLDHILGEALDAWERSKENAEKVRTKSTGIKDDGEPQQVVQGEDGRDHSQPVERPGMYLGADGEEVDEDTRAVLLSAVGMKPDGSLLNVVEKVEESKGQVGDPRFLKAAMDAQAAKRDIWGLNAPKPDAAGTQVIVKVYEGVNVENLVKDAAGGDSST